MPLATANATRRSIRSVAAFEAAKGILVLLAASGLLLLVHRDLHALAAALIEHAHLNPAAKYPGIFLDAVDHFQDLRLRWLAAGAAAYSTLRFVEAWGLWHDRRWAEILAAASGTIYLPFELANLMRGFSWLSLGALLVNLAIVVLMLLALRQRRRISQASP
ncbi:MAG: DUF2127 domain-containing protein [Azonexaceae bacterium]|nr:DUF2127 domain-containing protein [Azonexaceae bacterium]